MYTAVNGTTQILRLTVKISTENALTLQWISYTGDLGGQVCVRCLQCISFMIFRTEKRVSYTLSPSYAKYANEIRLFPRLYERFIIAHLAYYNRRIMKQIDEFIRLFRRNKFAYFKGISAVPKFVLCYIMIQNSWIMSNMQHSWSTSLQTLSRFHECLSMKSVGQYILRDNSE